MIEPLDIPAALLKESPFLAEMKRYNMRRELVQIPRLTIGQRDITYHPDGGTTEVIPPRVPEFEILELRAVRHAANCTSTGAFMCDVPDAIRHRRASAIKMLAAGLEHDALEAFTLSTLHESCTFEFDGVIKAFETACRTLPTKYRRDHSKLRLFVSKDVYYGYKRAIALRTAGIYIRKKSELTYGGIPLRIVEEMGRGTILLTAPDNLVWGMMGEGETHLVPHPSRDEETLYVTVDADFIMQNGDAAVFGTMLVVGNLERRWILFKRKIRGYWHDFKKWVKGDAA